MSTGQVLIAVLGLLVLAGGVDQYVRTTRILKMLRAMAPLFEAGLDNPAARSELASLQHAIGIAQERDRVATRWFLIGIYGLAVAVLVYSFAG